jgi:hypothetical protein
MLTKTEHKKIQTQAKHKEVKKARDLKVEGQSS